MIDDGLFTDTSQVETITPYRKLRNLRGWSLEEAAEQFSVSRHLLIAIEHGRRDCPKWLVRKMDKEYGCGGKLIEYWLPRFSLAPARQVSVWERLKIWFSRRWQRGFNLSIF